VSIVRQQNARFDWTVPVVIVGGGACGLTAALAAQDAGANVIVLERDRRPTGSTGMSYGAICAAGSQLQTSAGIDDTPALLRDDILAITRGETDPELARTIADNAGATIDWLCEQHELALHVDRNWTGLGHQHPRLHAPSNRSGESLMNMLLAACDRAGIDIVTSATVNALVADEAARVSGVHIKRPDGAIEELGCSALILASCGFGANRELVEKYIPELADARYHGHEGNQGDGIQWGMALGGRVADMGAYQSLGSLATPQSMVIPHTLLIGGGVQVNALGQRFENELDDISGQALTVLDQPEGYCWIVYDQRLHAQALEAYQEYRDAIDLGTARSADSWQALASVTGIPAGALENTMTDVARLAAANDGDSFGRTFYDNENLEAPFYAIRVTGALFHTQGGLCVDADARVVTADGDPLPNLFAGGGAARSVSGPGGWGYLPGMGLCTAVTLGGIAGRAAARLVETGE
jgi:fumarate reductase flavoprotein subunit